MKNTGILIGGFLAVVAGLLIVTYNLRSKANRINDAVEKGVISLQEDQRMQKKKLNMILASEHLGMNLPSEINNSLVLVLPDEICYTCYYGTADTLKVFLDDNSLQPVVVGNFDNENILKNNIRQLGFDSYSFYNIRNREKLPIDNLNVPYLFFYREGICEYFYILEKNDWASLPLYVDLIKRIL